MKKSERAARESTTGARQAGERLRLLFVDDEDNIRLTLPLLLEQHGFDVTTVGAVADALVQISAVSFDVLLTDLNTRISAHRRNLLRLAGQRYPPLWSRGTHFR